MHRREAAGRWRGADGSRLAAAVLDRLLTGGSLDGLPVERHDGVVDLQGFAVPDPEVVGTGVLGEHAAAATSGLRMLRFGPLVEFRDLTLTGLDLGSSRLNHLRFFDTTLHGCRFDLAGCRDWRGWGLRVHDCSFSGADLRDSVLGTWHEGRGNHYQRVRFDRADLRGSVMRCASFVDCDFSDARLDGVEFHGCQFVRCRFAGLLDEVSFHARVPGDESAPPGSFEDVDLSGAVLRWVDFRGLSLDRVTLPAEGAEHVVVRHYPEVVRAAVARLSGGHDAETRALRSRLTVDVDLLDGSRTVGVWHVDELGDTEERQRYARELLHGIERECAADDGTASRA